MKAKYIQTLLLSNGDMFDIGIPVEHTIGMYKSDCEGKVKYVIERLNQEERGAVLLPPEWEIAYKGNIYALSN